MAFNAALVESLPPDLLQTIPGGVPPPDTVPNLVNPPRYALAPIVVGSVFLVVAIVLFVVRIYTKFVIVNKLAWDDAFCATGLCFAIVYFAGIVLGCTTGAAGRHQYDSSLASLLSKPNLLASWITTVMVTPALGFIKMTFFIQYYTLFWPLRWVRLSVYIGATLSATFYIVTTITMFILESPWPGQSWVQDLLSPHYGLGDQFSIPTGAVGAAIDLYLLVLPIRAVLNLQLPRRKKIGLIFIFLTGTLASIASLVGVYYRAMVVKHVDEALWWVARMWVWLSIEMFSGIACSCMPSLSKLVSYHRIPLTNLSSQLTGRPLLGYRKSKDHIHLSDS